LEERFTARCDALEASIDARFTQVHATMASNLRVVLSALGKEQ
jgi:hypothetical protein